MENLSLLLIQSGGGFFGPLIGGSDGAAAAVHGKGAYGRRGAEPGRQEFSRHSWSSASRRWSTSDTFSDTERCTFQPRACAVAGRRVVLLRVGMPRRSARARARQLHDVGREPLESEDDFNFQTPGVTLKPINLA